MDRSELPDHGREIDDLEYCTDPFRRHIILASKIVATWPAWKRKLLENSLKPTLDKPRETI